MFSEHCFCEKHKFQSNPKNFMQKIKNIFPLEINKLYIKAAHFGLEMWDLLKTLSTSGP